MITASDQWFWRIPSVWSIRVWPPGHTAFHHFDKVELATCKAIARISVGDCEDIELAAQAARAAFKEHWGLKVPGAARSKLLHKLADLVDANTDQIAALEALNVGQSDTLINWITLIRYC